MRCLTVVGILGAWLFTASSWAQPPANESIAKKPANTEKKDGKAADNPLDQLLAEALKNNPDIRVAEAKVREVEAEAARTRLNVLGQVSVLHANIMAARAAEREGFDRLKSTEKLYAAHAISKEDLGAAKLTYFKLNNELLAAEAKLPYLLGRHPALQSTADRIDDAIKKKWLGLAQDAKTSDTEFLRRVSLDVHGRVPTPEETRKFLSWPEKERRGLWMNGILKSDKMVDPNVLSTPGNPFEKVDPELADKLRKALAKSYTLKADNLPQSEAVEFVRSHLTGINVQARALAGKRALNFNLAEPVPMGAILQCLEDDLRLVFVLRDYGIVVVEADEALPPGALRVVDFWKHERTKKTKALTDPNANPDLDGVRGIIEKIDPKDPELVQISIGSNAGLAKGQTLEVFRLQPLPQYAGSIRIVEASATHAVARRQYASGVAYPQVGDQVAARLARGK